MTYIKFQWDDNKSKNNIKKHGISFEEAKTVFFDEHSRVIRDDKHSITEERFIMMGLSCNLRLLIVVHTYDEADEIIRIISSRKATKTESKYYERWS